MDELSLIGFFLGIIGLVLITSFIIDKKRQKK